jgi:hypothetical protein
MMTIIIDVSICLMKTLQVKVTEFFSGGSFSIHDHRNDQKPHLLFESKPLTENPDQLRGTTSIRARATTRNTPATTTMTFKETDTFNTTQASATTAVSAAAATESYSTSNITPRSDTTKSCITPVEDKYQHFPDGRRFSFTFEAIMYPIFALLFIVICLSLF